MFSWILFSCCVMMWAILAFISDESKGKRGIYLSIFLPEEIRDEDELKSLIEEYREERKRWKIWSFLTMFLVLIPTNYISIPFSLMMLWYIVAPVVYYRIYAKFQRQIKALKEAQGYELSGDEMAWRGGIFYYRPDSKKVFVSQPGTMNSTMNLATPVGKWTMIIAGLITLASLGFSWGLILVDDWIPQKLEVDGQEIRIKGGSYSAKLLFEEIESIELLPKVESLYKESGSATDLYARGNFRVKDYGYVKVFLYRSCDSCILIRNQGKTILYNEKTEEETQALYEQLTNLGI
ncbi:MAG: hypothetical protein JW708_07300 [Vallitaleaceae bacterium]|nr:hypothetical protein [Vallitaleaceae bacterium]